MFCTITIVNNNGLNIKFSFLVNPLRKRFKQKQNHGQKGICSNKVARSIVISRNIPQISFKINESNCKLSLKNLKVYILSLLAFKMVSFIS